MKTINLGKSRWWKDNKEWITSLAIVIAIVFAIFCVLAFFWNMDDETKRYDDQIAILYQEYPQLKKDLDAITEDGVIRTYEWNRIYTLYQRERFKGMSERIGN